MTATAELNFLKRASRKFDAATLSHAIEKAHKRNKRKGHTRDSSGKAHRLRAFFCPPKKKGASKTTQLHCDNNSSNKKKENIQQYVLTSSEIWRGGGKGEWGSSSDGGSNGTIELWRRTRSLHASRVAQLGRSYTRGNEQTLQHKTGTNRMSANGDSTDAWSILAALDRVEKPVEKQ